MLSQRGIDGLIWCAEHGGAPYDLLAAALGVQLPYLTAPAARGVVARCAGALPVGAPAQVTVRDLPQGSGVFRSYPVLCGM